jgi:hypothetical protein
MVRLLGAVAAAAALAACVPRTAPPAQASAPPPQPAPLPAPIPAPAPPPVAWQDGPLSPGDWSYDNEAGAPFATFRSDRVSFTLRCEPNHAVLIGLGGVPSPALTLRTSYGERHLPAIVHFADAIAELPASDPLFDQLVFSRGRFLVQADGMPDLIVPAWPEAARVIEDCRR